MNKEGWRWIKRDEDEKWGMGMNKEEWGWIKGMRMNNAELG